MAPSPTPDSMNAPGPTATAVAVGADARAPAIASVPGFADLARQLAAAPHRLMFFAGAIAVLLSMAWWTCVLAAGLAGLAFPSPPVPAGWAHAVLTQYGMLPMFIFGFLLTVFPRWMNQPALPRRAFVPVFAGVFGGYVLAHAGLLGHRPLLLAGLALMLAGWCALLLALAPILWRNRARDRHALSCFAALVLGFAGLAAFFAFAAGASWVFAFAAIKLGTFGLLLPVYFTVCHRMVPFFSAAVVGPRYRTFRPAWSLPVLWLLVGAHAAGELTHRFDLLWLADIPLALFFAVHWIGWQPWKCRKPGLLAALHLAFAWLPVAFALFAVQSLTFRWTGDFILGRAPVHALTIGFFGSMLVAMVTRVTQGHSGRPLQMGAIPWLTFVLLQVVALTRIVAESAAHPAAWLVAAAVGWLCAFAPWVLRSAWIYLTPRLDGRPG